MKFAIYILILLTFMSCDKVIDIELPRYEPQLAIEMYLEDGKPLRCLVTETVPYTDTAINKPINDAEVQVSDGTNIVTLNYEYNQDPESGRFYNYVSTGVFVADSTKTYTLRVADAENRVATAATSFRQTIVPIDSLVSKQSLSNVDSFSVGVLFSDPEEDTNYYRFIVGKRLTDFRSDPTDFSLPDISFNGKPFSFYSEAAYAKNDTVTIRVYSLTKEHYEYRESARDARRANFNPFSQPGRVKSNVNGGVGIFTSVRYDEAKLVIP